MTSKVAIFFHTIFSSKKVQVIFYWKFEIITIFTVFYSCMGAVCNLKKMLFFNLRFHYGIKATGSTNSRVWIARAMYVNHGVVCKFKWFQNGSQIKDKNIVEYFTCCPCLAFFGCFREIPVCIHLGVLPLRFFWNGQNHQEMNMQKIKHIKGRNSNVLSSQCFAFKFAEKLSNYHWCYATMILTFDLGPPVLKQA